MSDIDKPKIVTRISIPGIEAVPSDAQMAAKYFLDIMNDGSPVMIDCTREILKAMWMRLAQKDPAYADNELGEAIGKWYRRMNTEEKI